VFQAVPPRNLSPRQVEISQSEPVQVATAELDLSKELKRGFAFVRQEKKR